MTRLLLLHNHGVEPSNEVGETEQVDADKHASIGVQNSSMFPAKWSSMPVKKSRRIMLALVLCCYIANSQILVGWSAALEPMC